MTTDYSDNKNYFIREIDNNNVYDLIFFVGTSALVHKSDNGVSDDFEAMRPLGKLNFDSIGAQLSSVTSTTGNKYTANVLVPLYRQLSLKYELDNMKDRNFVIDEIRAKEPGVDLLAFMDYYFTEINKDGKRPFVIAGHSQGGAATQVVLEEYFLKGHKKLLKNLIALYSIGYGVSRKSFASLDTRLDGKEMIHLGEGAKDINCILSWNTEGPNPVGPNFLLSAEPYDTYVINPLNWKTDETYAPKDLNLGVSIPDPSAKPEGGSLSAPHIMSYEYKDKFDAKIDLKRGCVVCSEPHSDQYIVFPGHENDNYWGGKSLHGLDGGAFYCNMSVNLGDRLDTCFGLM